MFPQNALLSRKTSPMRIFFYLFFFISPQVLQAQRDSSLLLEPERLMEVDIQDKNQTAKNIQIISATRSLVDADKQPFSVWVVTDEEIARFGFVTLGDVLRAAPGIRVSQPGNAVEGETFIMRGLSGNRYVKILINDVPIKSFVAVGMPIGAQLPIRQAARIEVMYGPAGVIYGLEACAGVVNIILKETERPVFTQADLSFSLNYSSMDLMFGGKLGRGKNILRYSLYGSNTIREKLDVYKDKSIYDPRKYVPNWLNDGIFLNNPNYEESFGSDANTVFGKQSPITQESRLFGMDLTWRGLHFNYNRMVRIEPNALGQSPLALSYANPSNRIAERQQSFTLSFSRKKKRRTAFNYLSLSNYNVGGTSSSTYIFDRGSMAQMRAWMIAGNTSFSLQDSAFNLFSKGQRFSSASGLDFRLESRHNIRLYRRLYMDAGIQLHVMGDGFGLWQYSKRQSDDGTYISDGEISPIFLDNTDENTFNTWGQLSWNSKKLHATLGLGVNFEAFTFNNLVPAFRTGLYYQMDSTWSIRANASTGLNQSSPFHRAQSYVFSKSEGRVAQLSSFYNNNILRSSERFQAVEFGFRRGRRSATNIEGSFFAQRSYNLIRNGGFREIKDIAYNPITGTQDTTKFTYFGYYSSPGKSTALYGFQLLYRTKGSGGLTINFGSNSKYRIISRTELSLQYARGKEWFGSDFPATSEPLNFPKWHTQFRFFIKINESAEIILAANQQSSVLSKAVVYKDYYQLPDRQLRHPKYRSWDIMIRTFLSKQFTTYIMVQNLFNKKIYGIDASGSPDDLIYNPQPGRFLRLGVNYNMN
jgi:TonB-dependent Receptor Plug Domain